ncbi:MAG: DNA gyrase inhibitor YacG, partial [Alphaproteobacteria bacterium]|nr:DNA gyrase inhibitor YacG [Alphaproteobacteria bacterium]
MAVQCPTCGNPAEKPHSPFCCRRCAQADLGRWFSGKYGVEAEIEPDSADVEALERAIQEAMEDGTLVKGPFSR